MDFIKIENPESLSLSVKAKITQSLKKYNYALYKFNGISGIENSKAAIKSLAGQLGLKNLDSHLMSDEDAITPLAVSENKGSYIPYTDKAISWHTDGYYNEPQKTIRAIILHSVALPVSGGANQFLDHREIYSWLKAQNEKYLKVLSENDVMTIPANIVDGKTIREAITGPVFSFDAEQNLHMRYTARKRNIIWKQDKLVNEARELILEYLHNPHIPKVRLEPGQGIVCNNVLHNREAFMDDEENSRIMLRARYYERVSLNDA